MARAPASRVLVVHPGSLGDVLLARPALHALRHGDPPADLILVADREVGELLREAEEVQEVWPLEGAFLADLLTGSVPATDPRRSPLGQCAIAVAWLSDPEGRLRAALERMGVGVVFLGSPHAPTCSGAHQSERFLETIRGAPIGSPHCGGLRLPAALLREGRDRVARLVGTVGGPLVVLHPGSGSREKCCRPLLLAELARRLRAGGLSPVLVSGPADEAIVAEVRSHVDGTVPVVGHVSLRSLAGLLAAVGAFVGHDSGVTHLAAALGVPVVALFGPTEARRWAPRGARVRILSGEPCRCVGWEEVRSCRDKPCLNLSVDEVVSACLDLLRRGSEDRGTTSGSDPQLEVPTRLC